MNKGTQRLNEKLDRLIGLVEHGCTFNAAAAALGYDSNSTASLRFRARRGVAPYTRLLPYVGEVRETSKVLARVIERVKAGETYVEAMLAEGYSRGSAKVALYRARHGEALYAPLLALGPALRMRRTDERGLARERGAPAERFGRVVERVKAGETFVEAMLAEGYTRAGAKTAMHRARSGAAMFAPLLALGPALRMRRTDERDPRCRERGASAERVGRVVERVKGGEAYVDAMLAEGYTRAGAKSALVRARSGVASYAPLLALGPALTMRRDVLPRSAATSSPVQPSLFEAPPKLVAAPAANDTAPLDDETLAALELLLAL